MFNIVRNSWKACGLVLLACLAGWRAGAAQAAEQQQVTVVEQQVKALDGAVSKLSSNLPKEQPALGEHALDAVVKGLASKEQVTAVEQQVKALDGAVSKLSSGLVTKEQLASVERQVKTLGEGIGRLLEMQKLSAQLQKDLDTAKSEAKKASQAKQEAEAKIKMLEQEIADLQKRVSEPETPKE
jgi:chromosome segregation ATPase